MHTGVRLGTVALGTWASALPTASLRAKRAHIGHLSAYLQHGRLWTANCSLGAVDFTSYESGSAYLLDWHTSSDVIISYRQPSNRVCLASDVPAAQATWSRPSDPFAQCDIRGIVAGTDTDTTTNAWQSMSFIRWHYDKDSSSCVAP